MRIYRSCWISLPGGRAGTDLIHNNSLHYLPIAMASHADDSSFDQPAHAANPVAGVCDPGAPRMPGHVCRGQRHTARMWSHLIPDACVIRTESTLTVEVGPGGGPAIWAGRLVPEKGPHWPSRRAIKAGVELWLAGLCKTLNTSRNESGRGSACASATSAM